MLTPTHYVASDRPINLQLHTIAQLQQQLKVAKELRCLDVEAADARRRDDLKEAREHADMHIKEAEKRADTCLKEAESRRRDELKEAREHAEKHVKEAEKHADAHLKVAEDHADVHNHAYIKG
jgi:vacuolar-type H+-ATPase subunit H